MFYVAGLDGHIQREVKLNAWKRTSVRFFLFDKRRTIIFKFLKTIEEIIKYF